MCRTVTVLGATGRQGGAVVRALMSNPSIFIRAVVRDPNSHAARKLAQLKGVRLVQGDFSDKHSLVNALRGAHGAFVMTYSDLSEPNFYDKEIFEGRILADACLEAGVPHVVFSGQPYVRRTLGKASRELDAKAETAIYMESLGLPLTCVVLPWYFEYLTTFFPPRKVDWTTVELVLPLGDAPFHTMSIEDLGPVVSAILNDRGRYLHQTIFLTYEHLTTEDMASTLNHYLQPCGITVRDSKIGLDEYRLLNDPIQDDMANMFQFYQDGWFKGDAELSVILNPKGKSFTEWVKIHSEKLQEAFMRGLSESL